MRMRRYCDADVSCQEIEVDIVMWNADVGLRKCDLVRRETEL